MALLKLSRHGVRSACWGKSVLPRFNACLRH